MGREIRDEEEDSVAEYDKDFSKILIEAARFVESNGLESQEAIRAVLYLTKLACEITLKSLLEKAGRPIAGIKKHGHSLSKLLSDLDQCQIRKAERQAFFWIPASNLPGEPVDDRYENATVGTVLEAENHGVSKFPNQIRYGENFRDYPPEIWLRASEVLLSWAGQYWDTIRLWDKTSPRIRRDTEAGTRG